MPPFHTRAQYEQAFRIAREVIAQWDPYRLLAGGAPEDEFDPDVSRLMPRLERARSAADVAEAVLAVFGEMLAESGYGVGTCTAVGETLYRRLVAAGLLGHR